MSQLEGVLSEGQRRGLIGPGEISAHIEHALGFLRAATSVAGPAGLEVDGDGARAEKAEGAGPFEDAGQR